MGGKKKLKIEEIEEYLTLFNYILLETNYINQNQKLSIICDKGHQCSISIKCFKNGVRCKICSNLNRSIKQRKPFEDVKRTIEDNDYILLSNEIDYINQNSELSVICPKGHKKNISISGLKCAKFQCRECTNQRISDEKRTDGNIVVQTFINNGLIPKFKSNEYINAKQKLPYLCPNHLDEELKYTTYNELLHSKYVCKSCYLNNNSKENHWNWQGGISSLSEYLRIRLNEWKFESLKVYDFKCAITGVHSQNLEIHHLYNFSEIVKETLELLNLPILKVKDYLDDDLNKIELTFYEIHNKYGYGIPLTKEIHTLFHMIYGFKNNTHEQFDEFKRNYINNKYEEVIS